ncbi:MAG: signal peptidase I [Armatimonadota bacterium]
MTTSLAERLANINLIYIVAASVVLLAARLVLGRQESPFAKWASETVESVLVAVVLVFLVLRPFVVHAFFIPSESMVPTLEIGDHLLVNKLAYRFGDPERGDIIVFKAPKRASRDEVDFIKRVIGEPGDKVEIRDYKLYVNGKALKEPYIAEPMDSDYGPVKVPAGKLLVMGDNRNYSNDGRFWGFLPESRVLGRAAFRFWPLGRMSLLNR